MPYPQAKVRGATDGPLTGYRLVVKDCFDVAGFPTSIGSPWELAKSSPAQKDASAVKTLLEAGAVFAGKTICDEYCFSLNGRNIHFGTPRNGASPKRIPGGSSSGSAAAVSNGIADIGLGSDSGGSIRAPASHCGLFGMRPTHGRVDTLGSFVLANSFDTCGVLAADAQALELSMLQLLKCARVDQPKPGVAALLENTLTEVEPAVAAAVEPALDQLQSYFQGFEHFSIAQNEIDDAYGSYRVVQGSEAWTTHHALMERMPDVLGPGVKERFRFASSVTEYEISQAKNVRDDFRGRILDLLARYDVLILPTMPDIAPLRSASEAELDEYRNKAARLLCIAGLTGCPQITLPIACRENAPLGISLIGRPSADAWLLAICTAFTGVCNDLLWLNSAAHPN